MFGLHCGMHVSGRGWSVSSLAEQHQGVMGCRSPVSLMPSNISSTLLRGSPFTALRVMPRRLLDKCPHLR